MLPSCTPGSHSTAGVAEGHGQLTRALSAWQRCLVRGGASTGITSRQRLGKSCCDVTMDLN